MYIQDIRYRYQILLHFDMEKNHNGRWTQAEHEMFLQGLQIYGKNWKKIEQLIGSRTGCQIRSHAQKFFLKHKENNIDHDAQSQNLDKNGPNKDVHFSQELSADGKHQDHLDNETEISFLRMHLNKYTKDSGKTCGVDNDLFDFWNNCIEAPQKASKRKNSTESCFSETGQHQESLGQIKPLSKNHSFTPFEDNSFNSLEKIQKLRILH